MKKKMNFQEKIDLKIIMLNEQVLCPGKCYRGSLSLNEEGQFLFEEAVTSSRTDRRNPKLFDGKYISLVHMQNGRYQCHCRTINAHKVTDPIELATGIYNELLEAFDIIDMAASNEQDGISKH